MIQDARLRERQAWIAAVAVLVMMIGWLAAIVAALLLRNLHVDWHSWVAVGRAAWTILGAIARHAAPSAAGALLFSALGAALAVAFRTPPRQRNGVRHV